VLRPLFEVQGLRIAVADDRTWLKGDDGPVTEDGEQLGSGWVEIVPGASYRVNAGEVLGLSPANRRKGHRRHDPVQRPRVQTVSALAGRRRCALTQSAQAATDRRDL